MPPPASYVDITSDSFSYQVQVAEFNIANERWFRIVTTDDPVMFGWYVGLATSFNPDVDLFESDGSTQIDGTDGAISYSRPLANNSTYYIRVTNNTQPTIVIAFNTLWEWIPIGYNTIPYGTWLINDDLPYTGNDGFPSAIYGEDGTFLGYVGTIPAGEIGDALPDKTSLWHDRYGMYGGQLALFDAAQAFVDDFTPSPPLLTGVNAFPNIVNDGTDFYVIDRWNTGNVYKLDVSAVTLSAAIATIVPAAGTISGCGVKRDGSTMYWAEGGDSNVIRAWDLNTDTSLGAFYTIPDLGASFSVATTGVNDHPGEILVLLDGTVVTYVHDFTNNEDRLLYLAADGSLIQATTFDTTDDSIGIINHIFYSPLGSAYVRVWFFTDSSATVGRFADVELATGTVTTIFVKQLRNDGEGLVSGDDTIFSPSASCSVVTIGYGEPEDAPSPYLGFETRLPIRRLRITPTVTNENKRLFVPMIEIDAQVGVGNATGETEDTSPVLMVRQSTDGGYTWGNERTIGLGEIGKYNELLRLWRWNAGRRLVFEVSSSAAVPVVLTDLWVTAEAGDS